MSSLGIGIIGCGRMGERHAEAYSKIPFAKIVGFTDIDRARAVLLAEKFSADVFDDVNKIIADDRMNAVSICTPNAFHTDAALLAAESGKHIIVEKPLATNLDDCDRIIRYARKSGITAMVGQTHRFYPSNRAVKSILDEETVGQVRTVQDYSLDPGFVIGKGLTPQWVKQKEAGGGVVMDAVHAVDRLRWWFHEEIIEVQSHMMDKIRQDSATEEMAMVTLKMTNSITANLLTIAPSWGVRDNQTRIIGEKGVIYMRYGEDVRIGSKDWRIIDFPYKSSPPSYEHNLAGFKTELEEFLNSITAGRSPSVTLEDGKRAVQVVLAIYESSRTGKPVKIKKI